MDRAPATRTVVRTPRSPLAQPAEFVRDAWHDLRRSFGLAGQISRREIRRQYREGLLGPVTTLLTPVLMTVIGLGFRGTGILQAHSGPTPYALFVLAGAILWITFLDAVYAPVYGLLAEQRLLARANAPAEAIILGRLGPVVLNASFRGLLLLVALIWYARPVPATALLAPLGLASLIALGTAIGLLVAPLNMLYRSTSAVLLAVLTLWLLLAPVYFPVPPAGTLATLMKLNPLTPLLADTRTLILLGAPQRPWQSALVALGGAVMLVACWLYARIVLRVAIEHFSE